MPLTLAQERTFWMPEASSTFAPEVDFVFYMVFYISVFFTLLIAGLVVWFAIRNRDHGRRGELGKGPTHHTGLEMTWTMIPLIIVIIIFFYGFRGYLNMSNPPANALEVLVTAKKWAWTFKYPNGAVSDVLYAPVDRPVRLVLESQDVIHSIFVPEFRMKKDAVPGRYNKTWFLATQTGTYNLFCTEYCGTQHSMMLSKAVVLPYEEFVAKVEELGNIVGTMPPSQAGARLMEIHGCNQCHTLTGAPSTGPSFLDLYGTQEQLASGETVEVDEDYVRRSILEPAAELTAGYQNVMPPYAGRLSDAEITAIIAFMKSISEHYDGPPVDALPEGAAEEIPSGRPESAEEAVEESAAEPITAE